MAHLENKSAGITFDLGSEPLLIGTQAGCAVALSGKGVSAEHAEVVPTADGFKVVDLESREGTRVNGRYVNQHNLIEGDVIRIGEHEFTYHVGVEPSRSTAPARATRKPRATRGAPRAAAAAPSRGARRAPARGAAARRQEPEDDEFDYDDFDDEVARRERAKAKQANAKRLNVALIAVPSVLVIAFLINAMLPSDSINTRVTSQMITARDNLEWARVIELSKEAEDTGGHDWKRIQEMVAEAKVNLGNEQDTGRLQEALVAWREVQVWRQDNFKNNDEFVARIDAFLAEFGALGGAHVEEAKNQRVKLTGVASAQLPKDAAGAWASLQDLAERTKKTGTYGETLRQADLFWETYGARNRQLRSDFEALKKQLRTDAGFWFGKKAYMAKHNAQQGASGKARRILAKAVATLGMPEFEEKAAEVLKEINGM